MKYAITGHTYGIGQEIYNRLLPEIIGFSRTNGYDINDSKSRQRIIEKSIDCDVFINCAHNDYGQTLLFLDIWREWRNLSSKKIVNIGSNITEYKFLPKDYLHLLKYQSEKIILKEMSYRVQGFCKVEYVSFGYVDTPRNKEKYKNDKLKKYIPIKEAADLVINVCG
jgi:hypothetical protein